MWQSRRVKSCFIISFYRTFILFVSFYLRVQKTLMLVHVTSCECSKTFKTNPALQLRAISFSALYTFVNLTRAHFLTLWWFYISLFLNYKQKRTLCFQAEFYVKGYLLNNNLKQKYTLIFFLSYETRFTNIL